MTDDAEKTSGEVHLTPGSQYKILGEILVTADPIQFRFDGESMGPLVEQRVERFLFDLDVDTARQLVSDLQDRLPPTTA